MRLARLRQTGWHGHRHFLQQLGPALTTEQAGKSVMGLATDPAYTADAYLLTAGGLAALES